MRKKSPIYIDEVQLCAFTFSEIQIVGGLLRDLTFDKRHDFVSDIYMAGIAARIDFCNRHYNDLIPKGVRRDIDLSIIDITTRCEIASKQLKLNIRKDILAVTAYVDFPASETDFEAGHTYKLAVWDTKASSLLGEYIFHFFSQDELGHPSEWYTAQSAGLRPEYEGEIIYTSVDCPDYTDLNIRFNLKQNFGYNMPKILPEVELRLYYPCGSRVESYFIEPQCIDFNTNCYMAEFPFYTHHFGSGIYYAELLCMQYPVAGFVFSTSGSERKGEWTGKGIEPLEEYSPETARARYDNISPETEEDSETYDFDAALDKFITDCSDSAACTESNSENAKEQADRSHDNTPLLCSLDRLTGLRSVKEKLAVYERVVRFNKMRADKGLPVSPTPLHAMFLGSPGTGKTTVAKMMGVMLHRAGLLSKGHVVIRERATLLGQNYSAESEKTLAAIEEAQGGILLIDEAYQLYQPNDSRDPGKFVIETLLTTLADESKRDWMLILAGYPTEMRQMLDMNPGFKSRIPDSNIYIFDDFTEQELMEIAQNYLSRQHYSLAPDAHAALLDRINTDHSRHERNFGNARHIINLIQTEILPAMAVRVTNQGSIDESSLTEIQAADIPLPVNHPSPTRRRVGFKF